VVRESVKADRIRGLLRIPALLVFFPGFRTHGIVLLLGGMNVSQGIE